MLTMNRERAEGSTTDVAVLHVCLKCDYYGVNTERFCPLCGTGLVHCCAACGAGLANPFARYCVQCGQPLRTDAPSPEEPMVPAPSPAADA